MCFGQVHGKAHYNSDFQSNTWMFEFMFYCKASYSVETLYPSSKPESLGCEVGRYDPSPALIDCLISRTTLKNILRFLFIGMENEQELLSLFWLLVVTFSYSTLELSYFYMWT